MVDVLLNDVVAFPRGRCVLQEGRADIPTCWKSTSLGSPLSTQLDAGVSRARPSPGVLATLPAPRAGCYRSATPPGLRCAAWKGRHAGFGLFFYDDADADG